MTVAITGTDGFIGKKLVKFLEKNNVNTILINKKNFSDISDWNNVKNIK